MLIQQKALRIQHVCMPWLRFWSTRQHNSAAKEVSSIYQDAEIDCLSTATDFCVFLHCQLELRFSGESAFGMLDRRAGKVVIRERFSLGFEQWRNKLSLEPAHNSSMREARNVYVPLG
jgi:hypothetical protein